jgi:hypothetical protein
VPFTNGQAKPPNSGRRKGTPNRATVTLRERLTKLGADPVAEIVKLARDPGTTPELRGKLWLGLLDYIEAKPTRSVAVALPGASPGESALRSARDVLLERLSQAGERLRNGEDEPRIVQ